METVIDLQKYWEMLNKHDWLFEYSDDYSVYKRGLNESYRLKDLHVHGMEFKELYDKFFIWAHAPSNHAKPEKP